MEITINNIHKSIPRGLSFKLPNFCLLTGKNGSGKSHLLEALANTSISNIYEGSTQLTRIQHVGFNGLNPQVDEQCDTNQVLANVKQWWNQIDGISQDYKRALSNGESSQNPIENFLSRYGHNPALHSLINEVLSKSGKGLDQISEDDVLANISFIQIAQNQNSNLFFSQCALIFKAYHTRHVKNEFAEFRANKYGTNEIKFLSSQEFLEKFGPPPWELINDILARASLPYEVTNPEASDSDLPYRLRLLDRKKNIEISVNDLSSGEKVLISLALAIYNTQEGGSKPQLLLLDEPDAPLHPQFSKLLIDTLIKTIVGKAGVRVIMTTHSPSTVAMAPDSTVFEMDRDTKTPQMVSNSHAVDVLSAGIDYLRVTYEQRRQVFVESKFDVIYFSRLYKIVNKRYEFKYHPVFLEPHSGSSNCTDVISIVEKLTSSGSDLACGIIDYDLRNTSSGKIFVLGEGNRYAVENYILDPLYVVLALVRYGKKSFTDFGVSTRHVYTDAAFLTQEECQMIVENFLVTLGIKNFNAAACALENGMTITYPEEFLKHQGHDYEDKLKEVYGELNAISKGQGDSALKMGVMQVIEEFPQFLSKDIAASFAKIIDLT